MRSNGTLYFMLGDHLGSTSLMTFANGNVVSETRYKAWGEVRYSSAYAPTQYQFTGLRSYTSDFGLMFYNARWYDSSLSRFAQADTIVAGGIQGLDRYAYVNNSPVMYVDPSGHRCVPEDECDTPHGDKPVSVFLTSIPNSLKDSPYKDAFERGMGFVNQLLLHKGWWTPYLNSNDPETTWKFLLTLAYLFESYSYSQMPDWSIFKQYMTDSIINKVGDLYNDYGTASFYIYIGGREALFKARGAVR